jgi:hypothetical protein
MHVFPKVWAQRSLVLLACAGFGLLANRCQAGQLTVADYADGYDESTNGNGTFTFQDTSGTNLVIRQFTNTVIDRSIANFNLSSLPSNVSISSVSLEFSITSYTSNPGRVVDVMGFDTSGGVTLADATASASLLGSYNSYNLGLFGQTISLSTSTFESLLSGSSILGLRFQGDSETVNTSVDSLRGPFPPQPTLVINYSTPEPASIISALLAVACLGAWCRRRSSLANRALA